MWFLLLLGFLLIIFLEVPGMLIREQLGELWLFGGLLALGFLLNLVGLERWLVPTTTHWLEALFEPVALMLGMK